MASGKDSEKKSGERKQVVEPDYYFENRFLVFTAAYHIIRSGASVAKADAGIVRLGSKGHNG